MGLFSAPPLAIPTLADYRAKTYDVRGPGVADDRARPTFSVITIVYNGEAFLEETIRSVGRQEGEDFEYIIVDGGSTDRTLEIIQDSEGTVDRWMSESDNGMYDAINKGLALCRGRYVKVLNADDLLTPTSMKRAREAFEQHGDRVCVRSDLDVIDFDGNIIERMTTQRMIRYFEVFLHPSWYLPLAVYDELGLYATKYKVAADSEYAMRLLHHGVASVHLDEPLAQFRTGGMSEGFGGSREAFDIYRRYIGEGRAGYIATMQTYKKLRFHALARLVGQERAHAVRTWLKAAMTRP